MVLKGKTHTRNATLCFIFEVFFDGGGPLKKDTRIHLSRKKGPNQNSQIADICVCVCVCLSSTIAFRCSRPCLLQHPVCLTTQTTVRGHTISHVTSPPPTTALSHVQSPLGAVQAVKQWLGPREMVSTMFGSKCQINQLFGG